MRREAARGGDGASAVSVGPINEAARDVRYTLAYVWTSGQWQVVAGQLTGVRR